MSVLVHIEDVSLSFAGVRALDGVCLDVPEASLFAIIGPNGAGKTSLFNCISGVYRPERGRIVLGDRDITQRASHRMAGLGVARMFQNLALFDHLTVLDNLLTGRHHLVRSRFLSHLAWTPGARDEEVLHRRKVEEIIEFLNLETYRRQPVQILPYGVRKRVELGRALAMEPRLLLLDEPAAGLNQEETEDMARYLLDIKEELRITQILIEHELRFVLDLADRVAVLDFGRKIAEGTPAEISVHPAVIEAYMGSAWPGRAAEASPAPVAEASPAPVPDAAAGVPARTPGEPDAQRTEVPPPRAREARRSGAKESPIGELGLLAAGEPDPADLDRTLPGRLVRWAERRPHGVALREKHLGIWQEVTWRAYEDAVKAAARMLLELGVRPGDHVAIMSDNRTEWLFADLGAQSIGARTVGIYQTNPPADVAYILNDSRSVVLFCEDQEQVDKAIAIRAYTPSVRQVVIFDPRGTRDLDDPRLLGWDEFLARGRALCQDEDEHRAKGWFARLVARLDPGAPAIVVYTSGTTGPPKGALLSSHNAFHGSDLFALAMAIDEHDSVLSYLPLCHVAEKIFSQFIPLLTGAIVHFGESLDTVQADLREVSPTIFLGVPRIWEKMHASITIKMQNSSWLKRALFGWFARKGGDIADRARQGRRTPWDRLLGRLGDVLVYRPLQERLGLRRCRLPVTGAAPISPELVRWFHGVGVPMLEGYGQTECAGISHVNPPGAVRLGTVGTSLVECKLADDGEILVRGGNVFCGYLNQPEATAATIDEEGWLHTGDIGSIDDQGYLSITGRKKEIIITSGGKNLSPEKIENALKTSPFIKEAVAIGDMRNYVSALVQIEHDTVSDFATRRHIAFTSYEDLGRKPEVVALIKGEIERANELLARAEEVRAFRILPRELSQDEGELTATQKVRRRAVLAAYKDLIDSMYGART